MFGVSQQIAVEATDYPAAPPRLVHARAPSRAEAEEAVRTLIRWAGDDPAREGLLDTPSRVARAYREWFSGYGQDPAAMLARTFEEVGGYDEMVVLRDIPVKSYCEHHMAPIRGVAHVAYLPDGRVVGISKLARLVEGYARRLQVQERLTAEIADTLHRTLKPKGVAVVVDAAHECMSSRGVNTQGSSLLTRAFRGVFQQDEARRDVLAALRS